MNDSYPSGYFGKKPTSRAPREIDTSALSPYKKHLATFIQELPERARVLDLGCGSGKTIRVMQALRPDLRIEGSDFSAVGDFLPNGIPFTQCSVEEADVRFGADAFDAIVCQHVIEHLASPLGLMASIRSMLRPGGMLFLETPNWTRLFTPWAHFFFWNDYTHVRLYPKFALIKLLQEHGFSIARVIVRSTSTWFPPRGKKSNRIAEHTSITQTESAEHTSPYHYSWRLTRLFARAVNPLVRDVLIIVAQSDKEA